MSLMSNQEIFSKVYTFLLNQGLSAVSDDGACAYRGAEGTMCAVGCLIPDELYQEDIETTGVKSVVHEGILEEVVDCKDSKTIALLESLQSIHDNIVFVNDTPEVWLAAFKRDMEYLAGEENFEIPRC